jgi:hypothetical protein
MGDAMHSFSIEELEQLEENQLEFLRRAMQREIRSNPEIHRILRERLQPLYDRMATQRRTRRAPTSRSRRTPEPGSSE